MGKGSLIGIVLIIAAITIIANNIKEDYGNKENNVVIHELDDPGTLNPTNYSGAGSGYILELIYDALLGTDMKTLEIIPVLAESLPRIKVYSDTFIAFYYKIKEEAKWTDGKPVTGYDVAFSLKIIKNPHVDAPRLRPYYEMLDSIYINPDNPKEFTLFASQKYMNLIEMSGGFFILPEHLLDPEGLMRPFGLKVLTHHPEKVRDSEALRKFAEKYNDIKRDTALIKGSGPYILSKWETEQEIVLKRKSNWWADSLPEEKKNMFLVAYPEKVTRKIINDFTTMEVALMGRNLDVAAPREKQYIKFKNSKVITKYYNLYDTTSLAYVFIGLNMKNPKLSDVRVRRALAHLIDKNVIIKNFLLGLGTPVIGPIHPVLKKYYNDTIKPYEYNPEKARKLLKEAGWEDTDGDGILDKEINGERVPFVLSYIYNSGNDTRKNIGLLFQEEARKVGIKVVIQQLDWSVFLEKLDQRDFETCALAWIGGPRPSDPKQIWHTESYYAEGGDNFVGFGNAYTDSLIEAIRTELDEDKRAELWKLLQVEIHKQVPYIFLYAPKGLRVISKRFDAYVSIVRPGYNVREFKLKSPEL
ncbi:MAG: ABC transporter substrate-binding protein [Chlorobi bacterium]|nr:ABC transporter substrate-binding protein [Chlorobiota bacterium]